MDSTPLVEEDIELGRKALKALDDSQRLQVTACLWLYVPDSGVWRLVVSSPLVNAQGSREVYGRIQRALEQAGLADQLPLQRISAVSPQDPLLKLLGLAIRTGRGPANIRFTGNVLNNVLIEDAFIYRLMK